MLDLVVALLRRLLPDVRLGAGAEPLREVAADVDLRLGVGDPQLLQVGVDGDEVDLVDAGVDHPVDGVEPCAADTDDLNLGEVRAERADARVRQARRGLWQRLVVAGNWRLRDGRRGRGRRRNRSPRPGRTSITSSS